MLQSMKKPGGPKKKMLAETVTVSTKKTLPSAKSSISKDDAEAHMGRMNQMFDEQRELEEGERTFGPEYKKLNLKGYKQKSMDMKGNESVKTLYRSKEGDEEVEQSAPGSDILKVRKLGEAAKSNFPNFNESIKDRIGRVASERAAEGERKYKEILQKIGYSPKELAEHRKMYKDAGQEPPFDKFKKKYGLKEIGE